MELEEAKQKALEIASIANTTAVITTDDDYALAGELLTKIKGRAKDLDELRKSMTRPLDESKKKIMALFAKPQDDLALGEKRIKQAMLQYSQRKEEERRAEEERLRKEAEARARAAEAERLARMEEALSRGDEKKAEAILEEKAPTPPVIATVIHTAPKAAGVGVRKDWTWRATDINAIPREYMVVNEAMLTSIAKTTKGSMKIPGVEFYQKETIAASARY